MKKTATKKLKTSARSAKKLTASYEATQTTKRRKVNVTNLRSEDGVLKPRDRDKVVSETRILKRNSPTVGWMIRTHLDYITTFTYQPNTRITLKDGRHLDDVLSDLVGRWSKPANFDIAGRLDLQAATRLAESGRITEGDAFLMTLSNGTTQLIEGDRVRTPDAFGDWTRTGDILSNPFDDETVDLTKVVHGVEVTASGRPLRYLICDRNDNGFVLKAVIPARHVWQHVIFDRHDQVRGVSQFAAAINAFIDTHEATQYALGKAKLSQLFGFTFKTEGEPDSDAEREVDLTGGNTVDLGLNESFDIIESKNPSSEYQSFMTTVTQTGLKALDIPYSFFSEDFTNYSGARQALLQYQLSAENKRRAVQNMLDWLTRWRLSLFIADGELELPDGMTVDDLRWEWVPVGMPWIDPQKEANAEVTLIENKLSSRQQIMRKRGGNWFETMDQIAEEEAYIKSLGLSVSDAKPATEQRKADAAMEEQIAEAVAEAVAESTRGNS